MSQHLHGEIVPGCYRCELGLDEMKPASRGIPEEAWRDSYPIGEVPPPMDEWDALRAVTSSSSIHRVIEQVGLDIADTRDKRDAVINAATQLVGLHAAGIRFDSALGDVVLGGLIDAVKEYQGTVRTVDVPAALVENRRAEVERLDLAGLATGIFTSPKPVGGA